MTTNEYHNVDIIFLKSIAVVISALFIILMLVLGRIDLICYGIIGSFFLQRSRRQMGPRSLLLVISAGFGLCYYLLEPVENSMPLTYSIPSIYYYGYCKGSSEPVHYNILFKCHDGTRPEPAETE